MLASAAVHDIDLVLPVVGLALESAVKCTAEMSMMRSDVIVPWRAFDRAGLGLYSKMHRENPSLRATSVNSRWPTVLFW